jgi:hypothetical protein
VVTGQLRRRHAPPAPAGREAVRPVTKATR